MSRFAAHASGRWPAVRTICLLFLACMFAAPADAGSGRGHDRQPQEFNLVACYQMVQHEGRMIAWARWEEGFSLEKTRSGGFRDGTPMWMVNMIHDWIADAYQWQVTDEQIRQWAEELGDTEGLPSATRLTTHETIAIWMRRLARHCDNRQAQLRTEEPTVARLQAGQAAGD